MERKHLSEPWFTHVRNGTKTIEGRLCKGFWKEISVGDKILFFNDHNEEVVVQIVGKRFYGSFLAYLIFEGLETTLPGIDTFENGENVYLKYFTREEEKEYGVVALEMALVK